MLKGPRTVEQLLEAYPPGVQALAEAARKAVKKWLPRVAEEADASAPVIGYGYGAGYRGMVCTLILSKAGVKLGLVRGGDLEDPLGLLEGKGKVHRYISLSGPSDLRKPGVRELVKATHTAWEERSSAR